MIKNLKNYIYHLVKSFYRGDKFIYQRNLTRDFEFSQPLVIIYTMGKVGSTSIYESLKRYTSQYNIIHLHTLNKDYLKKRERLIKEEVYNKNQYSRHIYTHLLWKPIWVYKNLKKIQKPLHLITVVREPISRNISLFFQWMEFEETERTYSFKSRNERYPFQVTTSKDDLTPLYEIFINNFTHSSHTDWLQVELNSVFELDLLKIPFDKNKNFCIYEDSQKRLLTLKLENINQTFKEAIGVFLKEEIPLLTTNEASAKDINMVYDKFKAGLGLPKHYVDSLYTSEYVKHFYTSDEIEIFKSKWR